MADSFLPDNNGTFLLRVSGDTVTLTEGAGPDAVLSLDIAHLSSLVMGACSLEELLRMGQAALSDHSYAGDIQRAIGWSRKPVNITYF